MERIVDSGEWRVDSGEGESGEWIVERDSGVERVESG